MSHFAQVNYCQQVKKAEEEKNGKEKELPPAPCHRTPGHGVGIRYSRSGYALDPNSRSSY